LGVCLASTGFPDFASHSVRPPASFSARAREADLQRQLLTAETSCRVLEEELRLAREATAAEEALRQAAQREGDRVAANTVRLQEVRSGLDGPLVTTQVLPRISRRAKEQSDSRARSCRARHRNK